MYRADFVAADGQSWWLCETHLDFRIDEARRELGIALGFTESEWFADPNRRTLLFDLLESNRSPLLDDLDSLTGDDAKWQWLQGATSLAAPPPAAPPPAAPTEDHTTVAAQPAQADTPPAPPPPAPARRSIFTPKDADTAAPAQADTPPAPPPPAPARRSIFTPKDADTAAPPPAADGTAMDTPATKGDSDSTAGGPAEPRLDQSVQTVMADVTGDGLAGLAQDLGVETDELQAIVNHPDFEREVREEVARITVA